MRLFLSIHIWLLDSSRKYHQMIHHNVRAFNVCCCFFYSLANRQIKIRTDASLEKKNMKEKKQRNFECFKPDMMCYDVNTYSSNIERWHAM